MDCICGLVAIRSIYISRFFREPLQSRIDCLSQWRFGSILLYCSSKAISTSKDFASNWVKVMLCREYSCQVLISWDSMQGGKRKERMKWQRSCRGGVRQAEEGPWGGDGGVWAVLTNWHCCCTADIASACLPVHWTGAGSGSSSSWTSLCSCIRDVFLVLSEVIK